MTHHQFETHRPVDLFVEIGKGTVDLTTADTTETTVEITGAHADEVQVEQSGDQISIVAPRRTGFFSDSALEVSVVLPTSSNVATRLGSADLAARGRYGVGRVKTGSGDVYVEQFEAASTIETGSGDVRIDQAHDELRIKSGSGDVSLGRTSGGLVVSTGSGDVQVEASGGACLVKTGSGDLKIGDAEDDVTMTSGSGNLEIGATTRGKVTAKGASGDVHVGVRAGVPVWTDVTTVSGSVRSSLQGAGQPAEGQDHVEVRARTVSGDIVLSEV